MSVYVVPIYRNGSEDEGTSGSMEEYEVTSDLDPANNTVSVVDEEILDRRMVEAICCNLASIAESLEGIRRELRTANKYTAGAY